MNELLQISIGILILIFGILIGNILAKYTQEELSKGQKWFKLLTLIGLIGGVLGLIIKNDTLLFSFFFIAIIASRSIKIKNN